MLLIHLVFIKKHFYYQQFVDIMSSSPGRPKHIPKLFPKRMALFFFSLLQTNQFKAAQNLPYLELLQKVQLLHMVNQVQHYLGTHHPK